MSHCPVRKIQGWVWAEKGRAGHFILTFCCSGRGPFHLVALGTLGPEGTLVAQNFLNGILSQRQVVGAGTYYFLKFLWYRLEKLSLFTLLLRRLWRNRRRETENSSVFHAFQKTQWFYVQLKGPNVLLHEKGPTAKTKGENFDVVSGVHSKGEALGPSTGVTLT